MLGFYLQQSVPDTGELTFIAEESEEKEGGRRRGGKGSVLTIDTIE